MPGTINFLFDEFQSVNDVIKNLEMFENYCIQNDDLRGVFATAYLHISRSINKNLLEEKFRNNSWVRKYLVRFGDLYRIALVDYENGNVSRVPKSWKISFQTAKNREGLIIQHLLLGINAHINHDLAIALFDVKIDPDRNDKYVDHVLINQILEKATDGLKQEVANKYAPILRRLDQSVGSIDEKITNFSIPKAREHAWTFAGALTSSKNNSEERLLRTALDDQAAVLARLIMASPTRNKKFVRGVGFLKWVDRVVTKITGFFRGL